MATTCTDPAPLLTIDPSVDLAIVMSPIVGADDGAFTWTTKTRDGDTTRYCTNVEGDGIWHESMWTEDGWDQIMSPAEFTVRDCAPATRRRRIVAFLTNEGFEVTTGRVTPNATHPAGATSVMEF